MARHQGHVFNGEASFKETVCAFIALSDKVALRAGFFQHRIRLPAGQGGGAGDSCLQVTGV